MKKSHILLTAATLAASAGSLFGQFSTDMSDASLFNPNTNYTFTTDGGDDIATTTGVNYTSLQSVTSFAAPTIIGEYIHATVTQRITSGTAGLLGSPNTYVSQVGFSGATGSTQAIFSRRNPTGGGDTIGQAIGGSTEWVYDGWIDGTSTIGFDAGTPEAQVADTSDWFKQDLLITKTAAGYDIVATIYDMTDTVVHSSSILGATLGGATGIANDATWNLVIGSQQLDVSDVALLEFTSVSVVVPEPGTFALLAGLAALSFVAVRRRK